MDNQIITRIELFAVQSTLRLSGGTVRTGTLRIILRLTCGEAVSYSEGMILPDRKALDLIKWGSFLRGIIRTTLEEAREIMRHQQKEWTQGQALLLHTALTGMAQAESAPLKLAAGSATVYPSPATVPYAPLSASVLYEEAVSYYSILK